MTFSHTIGFTLDWNRCSPAATHSHGDQTVYADVSPVAPQNVSTPESRAHQGGVEMCICPRFAFTELCRLSAMRPNLQEWQPCSLYDSIDNRDKPVVRTHTFTHSVGQPPVNMLQSADSFDLDSDLFLFHSPCSHRASTTRSSSDTWGRRRQRQDCSMKDVQRQLRHERLIEFNNKKSHLFRVVDFVNPDYIWIYMCVLLIYWKIKWHFIIWKEVKLSYNISEDEPK